MVNQEVCNRIHNSVRAHDDILADAESQMAWPHLKIVLLVEDYSAENSKRSTAERKAIHPRQRKTETDGEEVSQHHKWYHNDLQN